MREKRINLRFSPEEYKAFDDMRQKEGTKFQELGARFFRAWLEGQEMTDIKKLGLEIPVDLHQRIKVETARRGVKMKDATEQAFESWLGTSAELPDSDERIEPDSPESTDKDDIVQATVRMPRALRKLIRIAAATLDLSMDAYIQAAAEARLAGTESEVNPSTPRQAENTNFSNSIAANTVLLEKLQNLEKLCDNILAAVGGKDEHYQERSPVQQPDTHEIAEATIQSLPPIGGTPAEIGHEAGDRGPTETGPSDHKRSGGPKPTGTGDPRPPKGRRRA